MNRHWIFLWLVAWSVNATSQVSINEIMSVNASTVQDENGAYSDWIELYNAGNESVDLCQWHLSDDLDDLMKWEISEAMIAPEGHLMVFASAKDRTGPGELHTDFRIDGDGEFIILSDHTGEVVDVYDPISLEADISFGNRNDGDSSERISFAGPTPAFGNADGYPFPGTLVPVEFSEPGGFYDAPFELDIQTIEGLTLRFTRDGSLPKATSEVYSEGIWLNDRQGEADNISQTVTGLNWKEPEVPGEKAHVIKAAAYYGDIRVSSVKTASYFISSRLDERYRDIPVISISVASDSLFSFEHGIYVPGIHHEFPESRSTGNYYMEGPDWERRAHFEYFDDEHVKQLSTDVGLRIHGKSTRMEPQKSLRVYARERYGEAYLDYPFFGDKDIQRFKRLLLRSPLSDFGNTMFRDELSTSLISHLDIDRQAAQTCIVFVNGEYWGIHAMRERIDRHYVAGNHDISPEELDLLTLNAIVEEGTQTDYQELIAYIQTEDLSEQLHYDHVASQVDIESYIDYYITQMYLANFDWPRLNIRYWKGHEETSRWRWVLYDCDRCMLDSDYDHLFDFIYEENHLNDWEEWISLLFNQLMRNEGFRRQFTQRFFYHIADTFEPSRVIAQIDSLEGLYRPLMNEHIDRWSRPGSIALWQQSIDEMRVFALSRPSYMADQLMDYLGPGMRVFPNPMPVAQQHITLDMTYSSSVDINATIYDVSGRVIDRPLLSPIEGQDDVRLSLASLRPGLYFISVSYGPLRFTERLIVQ